MIGPRTFLDKTGAIQHLEGIGLVFEVRKEWFVLSSYQRSPCSGFDTLCVAKLSLISCQTITRQYQTLTIFFNVNFHDSLLGGYA